MAIVSRLLIIAVLLSWCCCMGRKKVDVEDDEDKNDPAVQEERYRDVIKCGSCEKAVTRLVERAKRDPLGELIPSGTMRKRTISQKEKATRQARAIDIVEGACDTESGRERIYCDDAVGRFEDEMIELVVYDGEHPKYVKPEDLCLPACEYKTSMKKQIDGMKEQVRLMSQRPLLDEVVEVIKEFWYVWAALFCSVIAAAAFAQAKLVKRYELDENRRRIKTK
jgi:hypothetical protein